MRLVAVVSGSLTLEIVAGNGPVASNLVGSEVTKYVRHAAAAAAAKIARAAKRKLIISISVAAKLPRWQPTVSEALPENIVCSRKNALKSKLFDCATFAGFFLGIAKRTLSYYTRADPCLKLLQHFLSFLVLASLSHTPSTLIGRETCHALCLRHDMVVQRPHDQCATTFGPLGAPCIRTRFVLCHLG